MNRLAWDHNAYYHPLLLRQLPASCRRVLDVGCGAGAFSARLAERAEQVDALDCSPVMIQAARRRAPGNVTCWQADVMKAPLPAQHYDAITSVSVLHHLPLEGALRRLSCALRPGGVFAAIGLPRPDLPLEAPIELTAMAAHRLMGLALAGARNVRPRRACLAHDDTHEAMPVIDPELTVGQVRHRAASVLPGVRVRRLLFWRYLLVWQKPAFHPGTAVTAGRPRG